MVLEFITNFILNCYLFWWPCLRLNKIYVLYWFCCINRATWFSTSRSINTFGGLWHLPVMLWSYIWMSNEIKWRKRCFSLSQVTIGFSQLVVHLVQIWLMIIWLQIVDVDVTICCCFQFWWCYCNTLRMILSASLVLVNFQGQSATKTKTYFVCNRFVLNYIMPHAFSTVCTNDSKRYVVSKPLKTIPVCK